MLLKCDSAQACCYLNENGCKIAAHITTTSDLSQPSARRNITSFYQLKIHASVISMPCSFCVVIADVVGRNLDSGHSMYLNLILFSCCRQFCLSQPYFLIPTNTSEIAKKWAVIK